VLYGRAAVTERRREGVAGWVLDLARNPGGVLRSHLLLGPVDGRTRERVLRAVADADGGRWAAWLHEAWATFLGEAVDDAAGDEAALLELAAASAAEGRPLDPGALVALAPGSMVATVRAILAQAEVAADVGRRVDRLAGRLTGRRPLDPLRLVGDAASVAVLWPLAAPAVGTAAALRLAGRLAPPVPEVDGAPPDEANLLAHLLARTVPAYLANAGIRLALLRLPVPVTIGIRTGRSEASVRLARGRVEVTNGIRSGAAVVLEGDVEPLLQLAAGSLVRDLASLRLRRD